MLKKEELKKVLIPSIVLIVIEVMCFIIISNIQYKKYEDITNNTIANIINEVMKKYPETNEEEIIKILNDTKKEENENSNIVSIVENYGYQNQETYIKKLEENMNKSSIINIIFIVFFSIFLTMLFLIYNSRKNKKIKDINKYLNEINNKNYELQIKENGEDELSKLRNELYKTTILLKQTAQNSEEEKVALSNSLADISHQLKTPITSIRIMLDNIEENPQMDVNTKNEFIKEISTQIDWISSLIISLLKLAKFDAGSIIMKDEMVNVKELVDNVISNLAIMLELKGIQIEENIDTNITINADYKWQLEALTNIIKNAIEHSYENSKIYIIVEDNSVFTKIKIIDEGEGIAKEDLKHIFQRFYKAKSASESSIGIGLSLSKTIIEKENGYIKVDSEEGKHTTFEIKYLK